MREFSVCQRGPLTGNTIGQFGGAHLGSLLLRSCGFCALDAFSDGLRLFPVLLGEGRHLLCRHPPNGEVLRLCPSYFVSKVYEDGECFFFLPRRDPCSEVVCSNLLETKFKQREELLAANAVAPNPAV